MKTRSTKMRSATTRLAAVGVVAVLLAACGGDDGGGSVQDEVADEFLSEMSDADVEFDEDCVRDAIGEMSDDDAQAVLDSVEDDSAPDIGPEAVGVATDVMSCADMGAIADQMIDQLVDEMGEDNVDADCLRDAVDDFDPAEIENLNPASMLECVSIGG